MSLLSPIAPSGGGCNCPAPPSASSTRGGAWRAIITSSSKGLFGSKDYWAAAWDCPKDWSAGRENCWEGSSKWTCFSGSFSSSFASSSTSC